MTEAASAYRENEVLTTDRVGLVVVLYDLLLRDIREAVASLSEGNHERRAAAVSHCMLVLQQLQGTLDMEQGGVVAANLERFYNFTRAKLLEAQIKMSAEMFQQQIVFISSVREAWQQVRAEQREPAAPPQEENALSATPPGLLTPDEAGAAHWSA